MFNARTIRLFFCPPPPPFQPSQCWEQIVGVMLLCSMLEINDVVLYCIVLCCVALRCISLHFTSLHFTSLHFISLHCTALHCTALHCIALYCIVCIMHIYLPNKLFSSSSSSWYEHIITFHVSLQFSVVSLRLS